MANDVAPEGFVFVCFACGKRSRDKYGNQAIDRGWDGSCMLNCQAVEESRLRIENVRVVELLAHQNSGEQS